MRIPALDDVPRETAIDAHRLPPPPARWLCAVFCALLWWLGGSLPARAFVADATQGLTGAIPLGATLEVLRAPADPATERQVLSGARDAAFERVPASETLDCRGGSVCWLRFRLSRTPDAPADWMLHLRLAQPGDVALYAHDRPAGEAIGRAGREYPLNWRFASTELLFALALPTEPATYYLRLSGLSSAGHLSLLQATGFAFQQRKLGFYLSVSFGVALTLLMMNLILWRWLQDELHLRFAFLMFAASLLHVCQLAPWLTGVELDKDLQGAAQYFFQATTALFVLRLFEFRRHVPWFARVCHAVLWINALAMAVALFGRFGQVEYAMALLMGAWAACGIGVVAWLLAARGQRQLRLPAAVMLVPALVTILARVLWLGWLTPNHGEGPGLAWLALRLVFMLLLTIMVIERTQRTERELRGIRQRALDDALRAERELELKVQRRTQELAQSNALLVDEVSRRRLAESGLQSALETERKAVAQQRQFVAMASHEFRTPLAVIDAAAGSIDLVASQAPIQLRTTKIRRAVARLSNLIENFLTEDRMQAPDMGLKHERFDLRTLSHEALEMLGRQAEGRLHIAPAPQALNVRADRSLLAVALQNLAQNALKYSAADHRVTVALFAHDGMACAEVSDQGPGIAPPDQDRIFDKFYRGQTAGTQSGSGLGLYLVREIAQRHGGDVVLAASGPQGAVFRLMLPLDPRA